MTEFKIGQCVKSKTTGAIGKVVGKDGRPLKDMYYSVDWKKPSKKPAVGFPTIYQYHSDLKKVNKC